MKVEVFSFKNEMDLSLPYVINGISAGFPSPALDFEDSRIDLNKELIRHPLATYYGRVKGMSLKNAGIEDGDIMVIDKSLPAANGKIAVCFLDGEFTAKRILIKDGTVVLMPENEAYKPIKVTEENEFVVWGIVTYVIKAV